MESKIIPPMMFLPCNVRLFKYFCLRVHAENQGHRHGNLSAEGQGLYNRAGGGRCMEGVTPPEDWKVMNFGEKLIWLYEKQREIDEQLRESL
jgi:hypothetical protein